MKRLLVLPVLSLGMTLALALPALAKGPVEHASGQIVIGGPGLSTPIRLKGEVQGFQEPGSGFFPTVGDRGGEFTAFLFGSGLLSSGEAGTGELDGWYVLPPTNLRAIGPAYQITMQLTGEGWNESVTRQIYPFAPERPLIFTPPESVTTQVRTRMQHLKGLWWSASPALLRFLQANGLPESAPPVAEAPAVSVPRAADQQSQGWLFLWAAAALLGLLVAGVVAGRRRIRLA